MTSWRTAALQGVAVECDPAIPRSPNFAVAVALSESRHVVAHSATPVNFAGQRYVRNPNTITFTVVFLFLRLPHPSHSFYHTSRDLSARDCEVSYDLAGIGLSRQSCHELMQVLTPQFNTSPVSHASKTAECLNKTEKAELPLVVQKAGEQCCIGMHAIHMFCACQGTNVPYLYDRAIHTSTS